ncbi:MAG: efflux RND transporter permease subunit, partial [Myxococcales bacterium]|nr:efflux RND transporter permease subunit [Myxococcales bacterium]
EALRQQRGRNEVTVRVRLPEGERESERTLERLLVRTPTGGEVPLARVAEIERGRPRRLRAVGVDTGVEIEIWPLRNADGAALCPHVDEINALSSFDAFATIRRTVVDRIGRAQLRHRDAGGHADVEVGGLLPGDYLALATAVDPKDGGRRDDRIGHARCFSVHQRELELTFDIAGFKQWTQPRNTPVSTRQSFVRIGAGVRYTNWEYFEFGGRLGYELVEYTTEVVPSWDDLLLVELPPDGRVPISWRRHGLFVSPFVGVRVPFGRWPRITCGKGPDCATIKERRRANPALMTYFVDAQVAVNFGIADISSLPPELVASESSAVLEPDLDLGLKTGVRVRPRQVAGFGVFAGVLLTDLTNARTINARQQEFWTNDWGVRGIVGIELGLGLRGKRS